MKKKFLVDNSDVETKYDFPTVELWYPRLEGNVSKIMIGLMDVRAADDILVSYDFERDGWSIMQASTFEWDVEDEICDPDWAEVAFIRAWGRKKGNTEI